MCLGIPGEVIELMADHEDLAMVSVEGVKRAVNIGLLARSDGRSTCPATGSSSTSASPCPRSTRRRPRRRWSSSPGVGDAYTDELDGARRERHHDEDQP